MRFNHIIIAFSTNKRPPSFKDINDKNGDFVFSPLAKDEVYSADTALWGISGEGTFAPSAQYVQKCLKEWQENDHLFLMALIEHKDVKKAFFLPSCLLRMFSRRKILIRLFLLAMILLMYGRE